MEVLPALFKPNQSPYPPFFPMAQASEKAPAISMSHVKHQTTVISTKTSMVFLLNKLNHVCVSGCLFLEVALKIASSATVAPSGHPIEYDPCISL